MGDCMSERVYKVLFLCTGNSARSILGEAVLNTIGGGRFKGYSAGSIPKGAVHPLALKVLKDTDIATDGLSSKSWEVFAKPDAPVMDFVFTVCDDAAGETCPIWPGHPATAHWGIEDPAAVEGTPLEKETAFVTALRYMRNRITAFTSLPIKSLDSLALKDQLRRIGQLPGASKGQTS
jgi:arsenate reductase (thioredoxin)